MFPIAGRETVPSQWKVGEMSEFSRDQAENQFSLIGSKLHCPHHYKVLKL